MLLQWSGERVANQAQMHGTLLRPEPGHDRQIDFSQPNYFEIAVNSEQSDQRAPNNSKIFSLWRETKTWDTSSRPPTSRPQQRRQKHKPLKKSNKQRRFQRRTTTPRKLHLSRWKSVKNSSRTLACALFVSLSRAVFSLKGRGTGGALRSDARASKASTTPNTASARNSLCSTVFHNDKVLCFPTAVACSTSTPPKVRWLSKQKNSTRPLYAQHFVTLTLKSQKKSHWNRAKSQLST